MPLLQDSTKRRGSKTPAAANKRTPKTERGSGPSRPLSPSSRSAQRTFASSPRLVTFPSSPCLALEISPSLHSNRDDEAEKELGWIPAAYQTSALARVQYVVHVAKMMVFGTWMHCGLEASAVSGEDTAARLLSQWATVGVVSALMMSFTTASYDTVPSSLQNPSLSLPYGIEIDGINTNAALLSVSCVLFLTSVLAAVLLSMGINSINLSFTGEFVRQFKYLVTIPELTMTTGLYTYCIAFILRGYLLYGLLVMASEIAVFLLGVLVLIGGWSVMVLKLNVDGGLWERAAAGVELSPSSSSASSSQSDHSSSSPAASDTLPREGFDGSSGSEEYAYLAEYRRQQEEDRRKKKLVTRRGTASSMPSGRLDGAQQREEARGSGHSAYLAEYRRQQEEAEESRRKMLATTPPLSPPEETSQDHSEGNESAV